jgi:kynurenine formamidase
MSRTTRYVDLSHRIETGMPVAPRLPSPRIEPHLTHAASRAIYGGEAEFEITRLFLVGNTGTALDSPAHRFAGRADVAALPIEALVDLPGTLLDARGRWSRRRGVSVDPPVDHVRGHAVLIRTGWDRRWGSDGYWTGGPWLARSLVDRLLDGRPALVGVDFANVDDPKDLARPAHTRLLDADIPIVESLRALDQLPPTDFRVSTAPLAVAGAAALPVRAFARLG